jgi:tetratricopeptide (TPR) repeat protein
VLRAAVRRNPEDAIAFALLGNLNLYSLRIDDAAAAWEKAVALNPRMQIERGDLSRAVAMLHPGPAEGTAREPVSAAVRAGPKTAEEMAVDAMLAAASGPHPEADKTFGTKTFEEEKQPQLVRQAYIEVRLQTLLADSASGKCERIDDRVERLGREPNTIQFTLYGFGQFMKAAHFQYYLGVIEANCGQARQARKYWAKVAKLKEPASSPEFAYSLLATGRLEGASAQASLTEAANRVPEGSGDSVAALNRALGLRAAGQENTALAQLSKVAKESADPLVRYLALIELGVKFR